MSRSKNSDAYILMLSLPLAALVIFSSAIGIFTHDFYARETINWQVQSLGQDRIDLFLIAPILIISSLLAYRNNRSMNFAWGGVLIYLIYTYSIFCFSVHFNRLFIVYCLILGLSFYAFIYFAYTQLLNAIQIDFSNKLLLRKVVGIYFIVISSTFYLLWLSEIIPAGIQNSSPKNLLDSGLFTNPVHVIDLSVFLPGIFIVGVLMLRGTQLGILLTPVTLTFFVLMDFTIGLLIMDMKERGLEGSSGIAFLMAILGVISLFFLMWHLKEIKAEEFKILKNAKMHVTI